MNPKHLFVLATLATCITLVLLSFAWHRVQTPLGFSKPLEQLTTPNKTTVTATTVGATTYRAKEEQETLVLVWKWPWGNVFPLDRCYTDYGISGCKLSVDRSLYSAADAIILHHSDIMYNKKSLPQQPRPHFQLWVWFNLEPPLTIRNLDMLDNLINLTMTFRRDSDIFHPYGGIETLKEPQNFTIPPKSKLVSWVVSKWYPGVPRIAYYEELKKHIPIDVYGAKHKKLRREDTHSTISQYKFYLAFENSIYKDYITEKLWSNAFGSGTVPVVLGTSRKNYERFVPGDAFIHVNDFPSAKELAAYLLMLDKDDEKYRKYFNWRSHYRVRQFKGPRYPYCKICEVVQQHSMYQVTQSVAKWFLEDVQV